MSKYIECGRMAARACVFACALAIAVQPALAEEQHQHHDHSGPNARPDDHAPIGVMGEHLHGAGEWMVSYRYMKMHMDGNRDGKKGESRGDVHDDFMVAPDEMDMEMHMLGFMYAPRDFLTFMVMVPFVKKSMDHTTRMDAEFTTKSTGLGDISATALIKLWRNDDHNVHLNAGLSVPTGSISERDETPMSMGANVVIPYPMQIGSGTLDLLPGITYNGERDDISWGAQARGTIRLGKNKHDYRMGNNYLLTGWGAYQVLDWMSAGLRMQYNQWFNYKSKDERITGDMIIVPTADPDRRAGKRLELGPSVNLIALNGPLAGVRVGVEALFPLVRDLDGPQLETDWTLIAGLQYAF